ncbi:signal peptidase I [Marmoricola sp. RAF53]|uniref:signal peptidase I n=1 Tax=Marmoricola sp. RAF53 TaxID=3233059 RepID=UPI003F952F4A
MRRFGQVVAWAVIVVSTAAVTVAVLVPRIGGATPYTILTGSMRPHLPPGTLVVAKPVRPADVHVGTVITYQLASGERPVVTHRVVEVGTATDGTARWRTQGDANPVPDALWVRPVQVKGRVWYAVPYLGRANSWISGEQRHRATVVVALGLFAYAALMLAGTLMDRRARR